MNGPLTVVAIEPSGPGATIHHCTALDAEGRGWLVAVEARYAADISRALRKGEPVTIDPPPWAVWGEVIVASEPE